MARRAFWIGPMLLEDLPNGPLQFDAVVDFQGRHVRRGLFSSRRRRGTDTELDASVLGRPRGTLDPRTDLESDNIFLVKLTYWLGI